MERRIPPVGRMNFQADETGFSVSPELVESEHTPERNFDEHFSSIEKLYRFNDFENNAKSSNGLAYRNRHGLPKLTPVRRRK